MTGVAPPTVLSCSSATKDARAINYVIPLDTTPRKAPSTMYFITVLLAVVVLLYFRAKSRSNKYKDYEGISLFQFLSSPRQIAQKLSKIRGVKFTRLETPGFTALCAQHPETAKVRLKKKEKLFVSVNIDL